MALGPIESIGSTVRGFTQASETERLTAQDPPLREPSGPSRQDVQAADAEAARQAEAEAEAQAQAERQQQRRTDESAGATTVGGRFDQYA